MYNILICDDQPDIVNALKIYLTPEGYHLFEAFNGKFARNTTKPKTLHRMQPTPLRPPGL